MDKTCTACKKVKPDDSFISKTGRMLKTCSKCRDIDLKKKVKKNITKKKHNIIDCVDINGTSDSYNEQKKIFITNMIMTSLKEDRQHERYDADRFIDKCFIKMIMDESMDCYRCKGRMQINECNQLLCCIDRLDDKVGYIKSNSILVCRGCI